MMQYKTKSENLAHILRYQIWAVTYLYVLVEKKVRSLKRSIPIEKKSFFFKNSSSEITALRESLSFIIVLIPTLWYNVIINTSILETKNFAHRS